MIFPYNSTLSRDEHRDKVLNFAIYRLIEDEPDWLRIHDPDFALARLLDAPIDPETPPFFWVSFIEAVTRVTNISKVHVLTTIGFTKYAKDNSILHGLKLEHDRCVSFVFQSHKSVGVTVTHFRNEKSTSSTPPFPQLYDRWIIWGREKMTKGFHFGHFHDEIYGKDVVITEFMNNAPHQMLIRFNELEAMCK